MMGLRAALWHGHLLVRRRQPHAAERAASEIDLYPARETVTLYPDRGYLTLYPDRGCLTIYPSDAH